MTERIFKSEYQDVYRIKDGVLLLVNKYEHNYNIYPWTIHQDSKPYLGSKYLKILISNYEHEDYTCGKIWRVPKGMILADCRPVKLVNKNKWKYEIKTTGNAFSGDKQEIIKYFNEIVSIINQ